MDAKNLSCGVLVSIALLGLCGCAVYRPAPGPQPYSYAPGTVYTSPFLNFGVGFLR